MLKFPENPKSGGEVHKDRRIQIGDAPLQQEVALCIAVLERAVIDCCSMNLSKRTRYDAFEWIFEPKIEAPFNFIEICESIGADPDHVQRMVMDSINKGEVYTQSTLAAKQRFMK